MTSSYLDHEDGDGLSDAAIERFARQLVLPGWDETTQKQLFSAHIAIIGLGGLGMPVLAYLAGAGIGFLPRWFSHEREGLQEVWPAQPEWHGSLWLVTHVDLHRTVKVQAFLTFLKEKVKGWKCESEEWSVKAS